MSITDIQDLQRTVSLTIIDCVGGQGLSAKSGAAVPTTEL